MPKLKIEVETTPNLYQGRKGESPKAFVIHVTEGTYESAKSWIQKITAAVSYNYVVKEDGTPVCFVHPNNAAWANGLIERPTWPGIHPTINPNLYTISIAYAGFASQGPTIEQVFTIAQLLKELSTQYEIPLDDLHVIGHNQIRGDKQCPGTKCEVTGLRYLATRF
jgi:N-acetyl-anhydromuramyl-L-alanine amidase AmpD